MLPDDDEEKTTIDAEQENGSVSVASVAEQPLLAVELDGRAKVSGADQTGPTPIPEADQKEMIRSAMSELGKRSAAARAKKRAELQQKA